MVFTSLVSESDEMVDIIGYNFYHVYFLKSQTYDFISYDMLVSIRMIEGRKYAYMYIFHALEVQSRV